MAYKRSILTLIAALLFAPIAFSANVIGNAQPIAWAAGTTPAAQNVTVSGTDCYMFWSRYPGVLGAGLGSAALNSVTGTTFSELPATTVDPAVGVVHWDAPATGTQSLLTTWDSAAGDGPNTIFVCVEDSGTGSWRDVDWDAADSATAVTVTLTTVATDLVVKFDSRFSGTAPAQSAGSWATPTGGTQTNVGSYSSRLSYIVAAGVTQTCDAEGESYSGVVCISIADGGGGGGNLLLRRRRH